MEFMKLLSGDTEIIKHIEAPEDFVFVSEDLQSEGFTIQPDNTRFRHIFTKGQAGAKLWAKAPCDGEYYPALQVQDTFGPFDEEFISPADEDCAPFVERLVELTVEDKFIGTFRFGGDDRKYYHFVTKNPVMLRKGDTVCYRVLEGDKALFTAIMLLKERPKEQTNGILNITTDNGEVRFWTKLASRVQIILGDLVLTENQYLNNHRFRIPKEYLGIRFVIEATDEQGNITRGRGTCRTVAVATNVAGTANPLRVALKSYQNPLTDRKDLSIKEALLPVQSVLPLGQGILFTEENICIVDEAGNVYATDCKVTSRWEDKSLRTVALTAILSVDGRAFFVENGAAAAESVAEEKQCAESGLDENAFYVQQEPCGIRVVTSGKEYHFVNASASILPDRELYAVLYDKDEERFVAFGGQYEIAEQGKNHIVISRVNHFLNGKKQHMKCLTNLHFYRGMDGYSLEFGFENDLMEQEFTVVSGLYLEEGAGLEGPAGAAGENCSGEKLKIFQLDENTVVENGQEKELRHPGAFAVNGQPMLIQDFWQNYPKSVELSEESLKIGICPFIEYPERYRHEDIRLESRWFFYLKTGKYEFHCGLQKCHTIIFGEDAEKLANVLFLPPEAKAVEESGAFGHIKCDCPDFPEYDDYMAKSLKIFEGHRENYREYGMLNYGDSYGEREIHWTNQEYDFTYGMLIHFLRTGDYRFYKMAQSAAAHYAEVDNSHKNIHFEENGYFFIHTVGHANNYYDHSLLPTSFEKIKSHIGHIFSQGLVEYYKATGIEKYKETVLACADSIAKYYTVKYDFLTEREPGWSMLTLEAAYELTLDPYYLNACRIIFERVYQKQDPKTGCLKYFMYEFSEDGSGERRVCYGGKSFMHGIIGSAVKYYYYLTGDVRAREVAMKIGSWLAEEMFDEKINQFWYTEGYKRAQHRVNLPEANIEIADVILFAALETGNKQYLEVVRKSFREMLESPYRRECDIAKVFAMRLRFAPEIMYYFNLGEQHENH